MTASGVVSPIMLCIDSMHEFRRAENERECDWKRTERKEISKHKYSGRKFQILEIRNDFLEYHRSRYFTVAAGRDILCDLQNLAFTKSTERSDNKSG